ncbi:TetR/AcrR family transcriptional regulator, partial [bacterium]|nr:TetR/AcrR family transcriptional regulator [bacterium]
LSTRERILAEAAILFASKGFHATSTRDIAQAVGIRQPSLFHHFPSKQDVLVELLDRDLRPALALIGAMRSAHAPAATRLYAYLHTDLAALIDFPFDARGLYNDDVLEGEPFAGQRVCREAFHTEVRHLVEEGISSGEFRHIDPEFARQVITAMTLDTIAIVGDHSDKDLTDRPGEIADFVLLGLLADPSTLAAVRNASTGIQQGGVKEQFRLE